MRCLLATLQPWEETAKANVAPIPPGKEITIAKKEYKMLSNWTAWARDTAKKLFPDEEYTTKPPGELVVPPEETTSQTVEPPGDATQVLQNMPEDTEDPWTAA